MRTDENRLEVALFGSQTLENLSVSQLKNPQSLPPNVASVLTAHGFTAGDYANILTLDPFAQGQMTIDPVRFAATTWSLPYQPPSTGPNCPGGICSCLAFTETVKNDFQGALMSGVKNDYNLGFNESAGLTKDLFSATVKATQTFTWSNSSSTENDMGGTQSAALTINCPSPAYTQPTDSTQMLIYWDRLFGTFLFVPAMTVAAQQPIHQGFLMRAGQPVAHVPVAITIAGTTYHTLTDNSGRYVFFGPASAVQKGVLTVGQSSFSFLCRRKRQRRLKFNSAAGLVNTGGFAWDDDTDAEEEYGLGVDAPEAGTTPKYFYPFGRDGEVYVVALEDAIANGPPVVAAYAKQLLDHIQKQKKQSLENTPRPRAHGCDPELRWRHDGFLKPFSR